jgi:hypothetical protein
VGNEQQQEGKIKLCKKICSRSDVTVACSTEVKTPRLGTKNLTFVDWAACTGDPLQTEKVFLTPSLEEN